jgi:hypothetical protein
MSELRPIEIDVLEDMLETLDQGGIPETTGLEDSGARRLVTERLAEYRVILQACRDAMPMQEVPEGLLDGVLEEARSSASQPAVARPGLWQRLRGAFIVPGLALAAAAVLVIVLVRPGADEHASVEAIAAADEAIDRARSKDAEAAAALPEPLADASLERGRSASEVEARGQGVLDTRTIEEEAPPASAAAPQESSDADDAAPKIGGLAVEAKPAASSKPSTVPSKRAARPRQDAPPAPPPASAAGASKGEAPGGATGSDRLWKAIETGDARRRAGKCSAARARYDEVLKAEGRPSDAALARAHAGLGLCEVMQGREAAADAHFTRARAVDPSISAFIERELERAER